MSDLKRGYLIPLFIIRLVKRILRSQLMGKMKQKVLRKHRGFL